MRTSCPRRINSSTRCEPMKPAPPVTRYLATGVPYPLVRPARLWQAGCDAQRVLVVQLFQHDVRQVHAVQLPERVVVTVVIEVLVLRLEDAPVIRVLSWLEGVLAEHDPVLILDEEIVSGARLPTKVVQDGATLDDDVRVGVEQRSGLLQVVGVPAEVGGHEARLRMALEDVVALLH